MEHALRFGDVVEAADRLTVEEQEELVEIVRKRMIAKRRGELLHDIRNTEGEYLQGQCAVVTSHEAVEQIFP